MADKRKDYQRDARKDMIGHLTLVLSAVGIILGFLFRGLVFNTFTAGTWVTFIAFILSLAAVQDHGSNKLAASAFWITFLSMCVTVYLGTNF